MKRPEAERGLDGLGRWRRPLVVFGFAWIIGIIAYLVFATKAAIATRIGFGEYGAIGLIELVGVWRGKDRDSEWNRRMRRLALGGFLVFGCLLLVGALTSR